MRIAHVIICHTIDPTPAVQSIPVLNDSVWYAYLHSDNPTLNDTVTNLMSLRQGNVFDYCTNRGIAKSWNDSIHLALESKCDAIILLNDDVIFREGAYQNFVHLIEKYMSHSEVGYLSALGHEVREDGTAVNIPQQMACCAILPRCIDRVGYFDENFSPAYFEDWDYMHRCLLREVASFTSQEVLVDHKRSSTINSMDYVHRSEIQKSIEKNERYFKSKWGRNGDWAHPFDSNFNDIRIDFKDRKNPYPHNLET